MMTPEQLQRYSRHILLKEIGGAGQNRLLKSRIAIVGAGGLGGPAALYLAAAGVGQLSLIDDDEVDLSNLQRQIQFGVPDIDQPKVQALRTRIGQLNPEIKISAHTVKLDANNAQELLSDHDLILDGTDDFTTRFIVNEASLTLKTPLISGALGTFKGQIGLFNTETNAPCYRCFVPDIPPDAQDCEQAGVLGALAGVIGAMMAMEAVKYLTQNSNLSGQIYLYDGLLNEARTVGLRKDPLCLGCTVKDVP